MRRDARGDAFWPTKTPNCDAHKSASMCTHGYQCMSVDVHLRKSRRVDERQCMPVHIFVQCALKRIHAQCASPYRSPSVGVIERQGPSMRFNARHCWQDSGWRDCLRLNSKWFLPRFTVSTAFISSKLIQIIELLEPY